MGLNDRSYVRRAPWQSGPSGFSDLPPIVKAILIANVVVFLLQIFVTRPRTMEDLSNQMPDYYFDEYAYVDEYYDALDAVQPSTLDKAADERDTPPSNASDVERETNSKELAAEQKTKESRKQEFEDARKEQMREMLRYMTRASIIQDWFELDPSKVRNGEIWRLVTSAFCHDPTSIFHILFNMLFLYWFGCRLESMYGSEEFCLFYFASAITASCAFLFLQWYTDDSTAAIGASGAIFGVSVLYAIHHPYETIRIYFLFPVQIRWLVLFYVIMDLHPVLLAMSQQRGFSDGTAHAAHLGGAAFGFLYFRNGWRLSPLWNSLPIVGQHGPWQPQAAPKRRSTNLKVLKPDEEPVTLKLADRELDRVLDKINAEGRASLTDEEVQILENASRRLRDD
jgi:membrane associated rhomboid family serine protease